MIQISTLDARRRPDDEGKMQETMLTVNRSEGAVPDLVSVLLRLLALLEAATQATAAGHVPNHHRPRATRQLEVEMEDQSA